MRFAGSVARPPPPAPSPRVTHRRPSPCRSGVTFALTFALGRVGPVGNKRCAAVPQVGERLGRYEVEKRRAAEEEDYDLAKEKQQQMAQFRSRVYEQLQLHSLLDAELVGARAPGCRWGARSP